MMRNLPIAAVVFAVGCFGEGPASAHEGPWCALISGGNGSVYEDCQYYSLEACRPVVLAGIAVFATRTRGGQARRHGLMCLAGGFRTARRRSHCSLA